MSRKKGISAPTHAFGALPKSERNYPRGIGYLKIGEVARMVGVSTSILRMWETLGLVSPLRTGSNYRLYTSRDLKLLKRARFLRRVRGLNAPAIVLALRQRGAAAPPTPGKPARYGPHLRRLRLKRKLCLAEVARSTGVSTGFLSAIERGHMNASVATLRRLTRFYQVNLLSLFDPSEANPRLVRPHERKVLEAVPGVRMELLAWGNTLMEPHLFRLAPGAGSGEAYAHDGEEFLHVLRGSLEIVLAEEERHLLNRGDSLYFESSTRHQWRNPGQREAVVLWVNTPPTF